MSATTEELVYATSEDGLLLEGLAVQPRSAARPLGVVWVHGNAARFYDHGYVAICRALAAHGYPSLSVNTRGHDISAFIWRGEDGQPRAWRGPQDMPVGGGAGWERLEESPRDLAAWVDVAAGMGVHGVVLAGHSSGAQRVSVYQAERQDARVRGLVLASPDLRSFFAPDELETAQRMVDEGRGMEVLPAQPFVPFYRQSAASIVSRAAVVAQLAGAARTVEVPVLAFVGDREPMSAQVLETAANYFGAGGRITTEVIGGADHAYSGTTDAVARTIATWLAGLG